MHDRTKLGRLFDEPHPRAGRHVESKRRVHAFRVAAASGIDVVESIREIAGRARRGREGTCCPTDVGQCRSITRGGLNAISPRRLAGAIDENEVGPRIQSDVDALVLFLPRLVVVVAPHLGVFVVASAFANVKRGVEIS